MDNATLIRQLQSIIDQLKGAALTTMYKHGNEYDTDDLLRALICRLFRCDDARKKWKPVVTIKWSGTSITFIGDKFMSNTTVDGGPFQLAVDKFVDDKGNTTTDTDIPVWAIDDPSIATLVAPDPANPQGAVLTLTGTMGAVNITAAFGDQSKIGTPGNYLLQGSLGVAPGNAVSGAIEITGPGVTP